MKRIMLRVGPLAATLSERRQALGQHVGNIEWAMYNFLTAHSVPWWKARRQQYALQLALSKFRDTQQAPRILLEHWHLAMEEWAKTQPFLVWTAPHGAEVIWGFWPDKAALARGIVAGRIQVLEHACWTGPLQLSQAVRFFLVIGGEAGAGYSLYRSRRHPVWMLEQQYVPPVYWLQNYLQYTDYGELPKEGERCIGCSCPGARLSRKRIMQRDYGF